jgi:hypothetical protein
MKRLRETEPAADSSAAGDLNLLGEQLEEVLSRGTRLRPTPSWLRLGAEDRPVPLAAEEAARLRSLLRRIRRDPA